MITVHNVVFQIKVSAGLLVCFYCFCLLSLLFMTVLTFVFVLAVRHAGRQVSLNRKFARKAMTKHMA